MHSAADTATSDAGADRDRVELILSQIEELPTLPAVAIRLLERVTDPTSSARDVVEVIEADQALTAKLLSLVRRSDLGVRGDVMTVDRVVVLLGFDAVRSAVLSVQIYETFASVEPHGETDFDRAEFWKHSLGAACAAQLIAERLPSGLRPAEAFVCGLLHDVGKMALDACLPKSYARVVRETLARHRCISDVEQDLLGLDHTIAGKRLLTRWRLPKPIIECAWLHHQSPQALPDAIESAALVAIVHLADELVRRHRIGFSGYNRQEPIQDIARELGLADGAVDEVLAALPQTIEQHCQLVGLDELTSTDVYAEALADANEELGRLNQSLAETNRRLQLRSSYFEALDRFHAGLTLDDRVADVCRQAARSSQSLLGVARTMAFAVIGDSPESRVLAVDGEGNWIDVGGGPTWAHGSGPSARRAVDAPRIMPVAEYSSALADRFGSAWAGRPLSMLPFLYAGRIVGGVLFSASDDVVFAHNQARQELEALCTAFGLATAEAIARRDGQRLQEELAEVNRQLHAAQAELLRNRSLAMIAQMAAGAAHELNNPLAVISGRAQMLARTRMEDQDRRALEIIREQTDRATMIVTELMAFAKPDPPKPEPAALGPWLQAFRDRWLERSSLGPAEFRLEISDLGASLFVDSHQIVNALDAIVSNAVEAMAGTSPRLVINSTSPTSDDTVVLSVRDNGKGMTPDVAEHALDPFFSHRAAGRGRGLGLSRAARLVDINGGRLWLESTEGRGTTVYLELPAKRRV